jgi:hypothetical protein
MLEQRAQELVVGCLAASAAVAAGSSLASGNVPGMRLVVGIAFTGAGLATVSMVAPDLAGSFAVLILTTTVFLYGGPLMEAVTAATGGPTHAPSSAPAPTSQKGSAAV